jgi:hypothetical protein
MWIKNGPCIIRAIAIDEAMISVFQWGMDIF